MSAPSSPPKRMGQAVARVAAMTLALAAAVAFAQPAWVANPDAAYPGRQVGLTGLAYVEAVTYPEGLTQEQTGLFVVCDEAAPDALDLFLWVGVLPAGAMDAAATLEVLTRRGDDPARSARWLVDADAAVGEVVVANANVRRLLLEDLRRGGNLAVRLVTDPAAGAAQPTFVYAVDGFPEDVLDCPARAAAANDPFAGAQVVPVDPAAPAPTDPFADAPAAPVDPFADAPAAPVDPFADAPAAPADPFADAPAAPADGADAEPLIDPTTGLLTLFGSVADFAPLPPQLELALTTADSDQAIVSVDAGGKLTALGALCDPEGGGANGFLIALASPAFAAYDESAALVLYVDGYEVGYVEVEVYRDEFGASGFLRYDEDELGLLLAVDAFPTLEAILTGTRERSDAYWSFETADLGAAIAGLDCAP